MNYLLNFLKVFKSLLFSFTVHLMHFPLPSGLRQVPMTVYEKSFTYLILMIHSEGNSSTYSINKVSLALVSHKTV